MLTVLSRSDTPCGGIYSGIFALPEALMIGLKKWREPNARETRILFVDELRQHFLGACCPPATIVMKRLSAVPRDARASLPPTPLPLQARSPA